jgi:hypothetical protein
LRRAAVYFAGGDFGVARGAAADGGRCAMTGRSELVGFRHR